MECLCWTLAEGADRALMSAVQKMSTTHLLLCSGLLPREVRGPRLQRLKDWPSYCFEKGMTHCFASYRKKVHRASNNAWNFVRAFRAAWGCHRPVDEEWQGLEVRGQTAISEAGHFFF